LHVAQFHLPGLQAVSKFYNGVQLLLGAAIATSTFKERSCLTAMYLLYNSDILARFLSEMNEKTAWMEGIQ